MLSIKSSVIYNINQTRQWHDQSYKSGLCRKQNWTFMTNGTRCQLWQKLDRITTWLIIHIWSTLKTKLSCRDRSDWVQFAMKTRQDNDMTNRTSAIYAKKETKLSWPIGSNVVYDENSIGKWHDWSNRSGLHQKWYWTIGTYLIECCLWWKLDRTTIWPIV